MFRFRHSYWLVMVVAIFSLLLSLSASADDDYAIIPSDPVIKPLAEVPSDVSEKKFSPEAAVIPPAFPTPPREEGERETPDSLSVSE